MPLPPAAESAGLRATAPQTVALTGGTGFIGRILINQLLLAGHAVRALARPHPGRTLARQAGLTWIAGDLTDTAALAQLVDGADAVIHCAGAVRGANRADFDRVNEAGVQHMVRAALGAASCRRFLLLSSLAARAPELSDYAGSKRRGEAMLVAEGNRLGWSILRPPAVYGPGDREMVGLFHSMARGWAPVPGNGRGRFSLIYVEDLATAILAWLHCGQDTQHVYEVDDGHAGGYDWNTAMAIASRVLRGGRPVRALHIPVGLLRALGALNLVTAGLRGTAPMLTPGKVRELTHDNWVCDSSAFQQMTGWRPAFPFDRGLACTLQAVVR